MQHHICQTQTEWEQVLSHFNEANFLASWEWSQFHTSLGKKVALVVGTDGEIITAAALLVTEVAKRGTYVTCAGGPLLNWHDEKVVVDFFAILKELAIAEGATFLRFRPQALESEIPAVLLKKINARTAPMHLTADFTLQLDITEPSEMVLSKMRKTTRYEIRRAQKLAIITELSDNPSDIQEFYEHQLTLATKHGFIPFSYQFLLKQFEAFLKTRSVILVHAKQHGQLLATAFVLFYNKEAVYHYGISTMQNDKLPGAYAAQWAAIEEARRRGCTRYNFWGITKTDQTDHRFSGVSIFKRGFGGTEVAYLPAHDIPLKPQYWFTYVFELIRKKMRRL